MSTKTNPFKRGICERCEHYYCTVDYYEDEDSEELIEDEVNWCYKKGKRCENVKRCDTFLDFVQCEYLFRNFACGDIDIPIKECKCCLKDEVINPFLLDCKNCEENKCD